MSSSSTVDEDNDIAVVGPSMHADASNENATVDGAALIPTTSTYDHENNNDHQLRVGISDDEGGINADSREHVGGSHDYDPNGSQCKCYLLPIRIMLLIVCM